MALLLDVFGFLSVLLRGLVLTAQSLAIGGVAFLVLLAHPLRTQLGASGGAAFERWRPAAAARVRRLTSSPLAGAVALACPRRRPRCRRSLGRAAAARRRRLWRAGRSHVAAAARLPHPLGH